MNNNRLSTKSRHEIVIDDFKLSKRFLETLAEDNEWSPIYTDVFRINNQGEKKRYRVGILTAFKLFSFSYHYTVRLKNGMILYPYVTKAGNLSFIYQSPNGFNKRYKNLQRIATVLAWIMNIIYPINRPQLTFEKMSERAQESGYAYFKYVRNNYPKEKLFFLIKKTSPDYYKLKEMKNVVEYGSFKHFYLLHRAKFFVSSETPGHSYFWRERMGVTPAVVSIKPYVFLQHGVIGLKKLDDIFSGDRLMSPVSFITSSKYEQTIVVNQLGYTQDRVPVTGLARWDMIDLKIERTNVRDKILLFYTWRPWLDNISSDDFVNSAYFKHVKNVFHSLRTQHLGKEIVVMMHPKMQSNLASVDVGNIKIWTDDDGPLNELMSSVALLITDYSSLAWEAYYREIPVVFDMFDEKEYVERVGRFMDFNHLPFGHKVTEQNTMNQILNEVQKNEYRMTENDYNNKSEYFKYQDGNASQRIHDIIRDLDFREFNKTRRKKIVRAIGQRFKKLIGR